MTASIHRPEADEYAPFYAGYVAVANSSGDVVAALEEQIREVRAAFGRVPAAHEGFRYAPGKWSFRQLAGHLGDGERVFGYRALRISRGDTTPLAGFDENEFVAAAPFEQTSLAALVQEFEWQRRSNVLLFRSLADAAWTRRGTASDAPVSVRALAAIMLGHTRHHLGVLRERYLSAIPAGPDTAS